jgi:hypothetical protein
MNSCDSAKILLPDARRLMPDACRLTPHFSNPFQELVQLIKYQYTILDLFG